MSDFGLEQRYAAGYPLVIFNGELSINALYHLHLVAQGCVERECKPVIIDLSGAVSVSDELGRQKYG